MVDVFVLLAPRLGLIRRRLYRKVLLRMFERHLSSRFETSRAPPACRFVRVRRCERRRLDMAGGCVAPPEWRKFGGNGKLELFTMGLRRAAKLFTIGGEGGLLRSPSAD